MAEAEPLLLSGTPSPAGRHIKPVDTGLAVEVGGSGAEKTGQGTWETWGARETLFCREHRAQQPTAVWGGGGGQSEHGFLKAKGFGRHSACPGLQGWGSSREVACSDCWRGVDGGTAGEDVGR